MFHVKAQYYVKFRKHFKESQQSMGDFPSKTINTGSKPNSHTQTINNMFKQYNQIGNPTKDTRKYWVGLHRSTG